MKRRPWPLVVLALIHLLTPVGNILINSVLMKVSPFYYAKALLAPGNLVHALVFFGVPILASGLIFACRRWTYWAYIVLMSVPFVYSFLSWSESPSLATGLILALFYLVNIAIVGYFSLPGVRVVYFNPALRWWETKPRYSTDFKAQMIVGDAQCDGHVKNISLGGLFIETLGEAPLNEFAKIRFHFAEQDYVVNCKPVFRRQMEPKGYGVKFELDATAADQIANLIARLKVEGVLHSSHVPGPEESFQYWLKNLLKSRQAWIPAAGQTAARKIS